MHTVLKLLAGVNRKLVRQSHIVYAIEISGTVALRTPVYSGLLRRFWS